MNILFKLLLTINTTSWVIVIYIIKEKWTIEHVPYWVTHFGVVLLLILFSWLALRISNSDCLGRESLTDCKEFSLADKDFLPVYLGYFFVSLSVNNCYSLLIVYGLVFIFTYIYQTQYFNPIYLIFRYHYYYILTHAGTRIFVIKKGKVIRRLEDIEFYNLRRINDSTFIDGDNKNE